MHINKGKHQRFCNQNRVQQKTSWTVFTLNSVQPLLTQLKGHKSVDSKEYLLFYSEANSLWKRQINAKTNAQVINNKVRNTCVSTSTMISMLKVHRFLRSESSLCLCRQERTGSIKQTPQTSNTPACSMFSDPVFECIPTSCSILFFPLINPPPTLTIPECENKSTLQINLIYNDQNAKLA